tara:strand:+ start:9285 stop:10016 length:732 start_codon:yes stop_codon:yes gene_type:complete
MAIDGDLESGAVTKVERALLVIRRTFHQRRTVRIIGIVWLFFVAYLLDVHTNVYHVSSATLPNGTRVVESLQSLVRNVTDFWESPELTALERYNRVKATPSDYETLVSAPFQFDATVRTAIDHVVSDIQAVIEAHEFSCLAAIHTGLATRIMIIKNEVYVNPTLTNTASKQTMSSREESAFRPGQVRTVDRFKEIAVRFQTPDGAWQSAQLKRMESVCAQHCVDAMGTVPRNERSLGSKYREL